VRRAALVLLVLLAANAFAAEKWIENYTRGVDAVNARRYAEGQSLLAKSIADRATEGTEVKAGTTILAVYTPHFWLGIAKFNLGDVDGALREWKISEDQGAIQRTAYYARLKDWVARAQTEKQLQAEKAASGAKKAADAAIRRAVELQGDALSAGGDRTEPYRDAQRRLQDALARFRQAGTNSAAYESVQETAEQAAQSFGAAAEEGKRLKALAANRPKPAPGPTGPRGIVIDVPVEEPKPTTTTTTTTVAPTPVPVNPRPNPPGPEPKTGTIVETPKPVTPAPVPVPAVPKADVTAAYRAFATGDLARAESLLNGIIMASQAAEAYLLRGCVRYTRALLSRTPDPLLLAATDDFRAALERNRALRLDPRVFSPKLVARFEQVRNGR